MSERGDHLRWLRSSRCEAGACVEVARDGNRVRMRDSSDPEGGMLVFTADEWGEFLRAVRSGTI